MRIEQGWRWAEGTSQPPVDALGPTPLPLPSQGGYYSEEVGWNVVGGELLEEGQDAPLPLWHYGARKQGRVACRQWQVSVYMSHTCVGWAWAAACQAGS